MSDSTIDDTIRLLESGRGNKERLKQIIETFENRSLISIQDRKYVEALVQQYLTPRHRIKIKKIEPINKQHADLPRTLKSTKPEFDFEKNREPSTDKINLKSSELEESINKICSTCGSKNSGGNNFCEICGDSFAGEKSTQDPVTSRSKDEISFEKYEREYLERQYEKTEEVVKKEKTEEVVKKEKTEEVVKKEKTEEEHVDYIEAKPDTVKNPKKKIIGFGIGIAVVIMIIGGVAWSVNSSDFVSTSQIEERITCDNKQLLVSSTKVPGFPNPERTLQYYLDRYNDEPNYKDWFDRNFPDQTIEDVLVSTKSGSASNNIPNFPDPEKDLQYYLDRYNDEPNYKDWFDRNFPDQTIQSVVCS
jgi:hypothetical protein